MALVTSQQGQRVIDSFDPVTYPGDQNRSAELGLDAGQIAALGGLAKVVGKLTGAVDSVAGVHREGGTGAGKTTGVDGVVPNGDGKSAATTNNFYRDGTALPDPIGSPSGVVVKPNPDKTTTVLGSCGLDMDNVINAQLGYPKTVDFNAKPGGMC